MPWQVEFDDGPVQQEYLPDVLRRYFSGIDPLKQAVEAYSALAQRAILQEHLENADIVDGSHYTWVLQAQPYTVLDATALPPEPENPRVVEDAHEWQGYANDLAAWEAWLAEHAGPQAENVWMYQQDFNLGSNPFTVLGHVVFDDIAATFGLTYDRAAGCYEPMVKVLFC
jgi:hypothetical protein